ncbi:hypothetical protein ACIGXF_16665 [Streptomyces sp. NPDC053086]|uniref:hypothetical protein n=1 Tax=unclassified Streptomyces TaxID=2593676 RepID=UPI0037CD2D19
MAAKTPTLDSARRAALLRKVDRAAAAHERTRRRLEEAVAEAHEAGISLTDVSVRAGYSREWVRKATMRIGDTQESALPAADDLDHATE